MIRTIIAIVHLLVCVESNFLKSQVPGKIPLKGAHFKVSAFEEPPLLIFQRDSKNTSAVSYSGFTKEYMDLMTNFLGCTYSFVEIPLQTVKNDGQGIDDTTIDFLKEKKVDIIGRGVAPSVTLNQIMDFSYPFVIAELAFIQPMPKIQNRFLATVKPFQPEVWLLTGIAIIGTVAAMTSATVLNPNLSKQSKKRSYYDSALSAIRRSGEYVYGTILGQGGYYEDNRISVRSTASAWCLAAFVLGYAYNSILTSFVSVPKYEPLIHTLDDMASSESLRFVVGKSTPLHYAALNASTGAGKVLGDKLRNNKAEAVLPLMETVYKLLLSGCCAYVEGDVFINLMIYQSLMANKGKCVLTAGRPLDYALVVSYGIEKNSPWRSAFDVGVLKMWESGIGRYLESSYYKNVDKCLAREVPRPRTRRLGLQDLASCFIILCIGIILSMVTFILELLIRVLHNNIRTQT